MGDEDPSTSEIESIVKQIEKPQFIKIKNMGHDFRQSEELCQLVASKIDEYVSK